jgi:hypothetical protein
LPAFPRLLLMTLAAWAGIAGAARAADCAFTPAPAAMLQTAAAVGDYRPVLKACVAPDGAKAVAIREMTLAGLRVDLLADPEALTTRLERAACWTCRDMSEGELSATRMGRAISETYPTFPPRHICAGRVATVTSVANVFRARVFALMVGY